MSVEYPIPRSVRQNDYTAVAGQTEFGPTDWLLFDALDVGVYLNGVLLDVADYSVVAADEDFPSVPSLFSIVLDTPCAEDDAVRVRGSRVHERSLNVTPGGAIRANLIERELDKHTIVLQELQRDLGGTQAASDAAVAAAAGATAQAGIATSERGLAETARTGAETAEENAKQAAAAAVAATAGKADKTTTISAGGLATGGGDLSANRTITVPAATQGEAEAGTDNATAMTPLRTAQAIAALAASSGGAPAEPQGRLTLTSATPDMASDVVAATAIYYAPSKGGYVPLFNGAAVAMDSFLASSTDDVGLTLTLDSDSGHSGYHQADRNFDLWWAYVSGTRYFGTGPAWNAGAVAGSDTARGTGAGSSEWEMFGGFKVNKNSMDLRYGPNSGDVVTVPARQATLLGSFRTTANGQTEMTMRPNAASGGTDNKLFLWNAYNQRSVQAVCRDAADSWNYTTATWRPYNGNTANVNNRISFLCGLAGTEISALASSIAINSTGVTVYSGIGLDATNTLADGCLPGIGPAFSATIAISAVAFLARTLGVIGLHRLQHLEYSNAGGTTTFFGDAGSADRIQAGLIAQLRM